MQTIETNVQPVPSAETVAAIVTEQAAEREAAKAKQAAKRNAKPSSTAKQAKRAKAAKPVTAAKPDQAKRDAARAALAAELDACRATAARFYNGASLAAHKAKPAKRADYVSRVQNPVQKPRGGNPSERDLSGLALLVSKQRGGNFDPVAVAFDLGILSRLAALGFVTYDAKADTFGFSKLGAERGRAMLRKAA